MWRISFIQISLILILLDPPPRNLGFSPWQEVCCLIEVLEVPSLTPLWFPSVLDSFCSSDWDFWNFLFLACLPVFRKSLSSKFFPFHSVLAPVCWSFGIYQWSLTLFWALSLGQEPMRFLTSWEVFRLFPSSFIGRDVVGITMLSVSFTSGGVKSSVLINEDSCRLWSHRLSGGFP